MRPFNGGNTGNSFVNFYMTNNVDGVVQACDRFGWIGTTAESFFGQINFERAECRHLVTISSDVRGLEMSSVHVEGFKPNSNGSSEGLFFLNNNTIFNIGTLQVEQSDINGSVTPNYSLFRIGGDAKVDVNGIIERDATVVNSPNLRFVQYAGSGITSSQVTVKNVNVSDFQVLEFSTPQGMVPALSVYRVYPLEGVKLSLDESVSWGPHVTERTVIFDSLTVGRSFIVDEARRYPGARVTIKNADSTFDVGVTANGATPTLTPGQSVVLTCDGTLWYES